MSPGSGNHQQNKPSATSTTTAAFRVISRPGARRRVLHPHHNNPHYIPQAKRSDRGTSNLKQTGVLQDDCGSSSAASVTSKSPACAPGNTSRKDSNSHPSSKRTSKMSNSGPSPTDQLDEMFAGTTIRDSGPKLVELTNSRSATPLPRTFPNPPSRSGSEGPHEPYPNPNPATNPLFTSLPLLRDLLQTKTSIDQDAVAEACLKIHSDPLNPLHHLNREAHIDFLEQGLGVDEDGEQLPPSFVVLDASRPWILYWCLIGLYCLGVDLAPYRERLIETLRPIQNHRTGGFGGGNGQTAHVAVTYAAVLALCTVGGREAFQLIDRVKMWKWLSSLKQVDGGFCVCDGGEEDVRGVYCALTLISLLGLPTELAPGDLERLRKQGEEIQQGKRTGGWGHDPKLVPQNLLDGTGEYLGRCQTYEGGIAGGPGGMEAHGGYAFCALAALSLLGEPEIMLKKYLDLPKLIHWLSARQYAPEGGFSGRTNKLVDGCYSTWVGGCWALVEAAMNGPQKDEPDEDESEEGEGEKTKQTQEERMAREAKKTEQGRGIVGSLWSRDGLVKYILGCCQAPRGGLRDKPGKSPDYYHSGYILLGLSSAQNYHYYVQTPEAQPPPPSPPLISTNPEELPPPTPTAPTALRAAFGWRTSHYIPTYTSPGNFDNSVIEKVLSTYDLDDEEMVDWLDREEDEGVGESLGDVGEWWRGDRVRRAHPVFNVPYENIREWEGYVWDVVNEGQREGSVAEYPSESWNV